MSQKWTRSYPGDSQILQRESLVLYEWSVNRSNPKLEVVCRIWSREVGKAP
jgi:hypothetical protein